MLSVFCQRSTVETISMRLDMYHHSSGPTARYQPTRANTDQEVMRLEAGLKNVNYYTATVSVNIRMHAIYRLMP